MTDLEFTNKERAILLALMALGTEVSNPELDARLGLTLDGASRRKLNDAKLITSWKSGRPYHHVLTDDGTQWCQQELSAPRPPRAGFLGGALYVVLAAIHRHLDRTGDTLGELFSAAPREDADRSASEEPGDREATTPGEPDVEARIRGAYRELAPAPGAWVGLAALRGLLGDLPQPEVDAALVRLERTPAVSIAPEVNQKTLTHQDREAAVLIGGKKKHLLAIADR